MIRELPGKLEKVIKQTMTREISSKVLALWVQVVDEVINLDTRLLHDALEA
jgi:hypothetical protein